MYTITPMVVAYGPQREKSRFTYMHNFGEKVDIPYVSWLLQGDGRNILVPAEARKLGFTYASVGRP